MESLSKQWWKNVLVRTIRTGAQTLAATITIGTPIWQLKWEGAIGITLTAMVAAIITALVAPESVK